MNPEPSESRRAEVRPVGMESTLTDSSPASRTMHPLLAKQPRYCPACGTKLELPEREGDAAACGHCTRPYDPADPSTFLAQPPPRPQRWWESDALPGAAWLVVYAAGCAVCGWRLPGWVVWIDGGAGMSGGGDPRAGMAAGVLMAVLWILFGFVPWVFACVYLLLLAFEHALRDEMIWYFTAGALFGLVCTLGFAPAILLLGLILGALAGLVRQWRMSLWAGL